MPEDNLPAASVDRRDQWPGRWVDVMHEAAREVAESRPGTADAGPEADVVAGGEPHVDDEWPL